MKNDNLKNKAGQSTLTVLKVRMQDGTIYDKLIVFYANFLGEIRKKQ